MLEPGRDTPRNNHLEKEKKRFFLNAYDRQPCSRIR
jgi:hypothetical protein